MTTDDFVTIRDLSFTRNGRLIFDDISLDVPRGKITAILGPSGVGKTTLLELIGGQLQPLKGTVMVNGQMIHDLPRKTLYQARKKMGMLFQTGGLFTHLTVFENVAFPIREHTRLSESMIRNLVLMKLEAVGLRGARDLMISELSGGMAHRVALARAIALDPDLMMYDEPFVGQDPISMGVLMKLIQLLNEQLQITSIIVSHDVSEVFQIADYVYILIDGKIKGDGTPLQLQKTRKSAVKQFLKGLPDGPVPFHYASQPLVDDLLGATNQ